MSRRNLLIGAGTIAAAAAGIGVVVRLAHSANSPTVISGAQRWRFPAESVYSSPMVANGLVYVGSDDGFVYTLDAIVGDRLGSFETDYLDPGNPETSGATLSWPMVADDVVYVGSGNGFVYALNLGREGGKRWSFQTPRAVTSSPAVANGVVYVGNRGGTVYALDACSGTRQWMFKTGGLVYSSPAVANGLVYVGSEDGYVYALNA